jgi:hypothetical protein
MDIKTFGLLLSSHCLECEGRVSSYETEGEGRFLGLVASAM